MMLSTELPCDCVEGPGDSDLRISRALLMYEFYVDDCMFCI